MKARVGQYWMRMRWFWNRTRFRWLEMSGHQKLTLGPGCCFMAPVRGGGEGRLSIGRGNIFGYWLSPRLGSGEIMLQARSREADIVIGDDNTFSNNVSIVANGRIEIGNGCQIGDLTAIYDCDFHAIDPEKRTQSPGEILPVRIGNNVWLGSRVMVLKGVEIGDNSVIGAMSLVTRSVPPNSIAAGVPARVLRTIGSSATSSVPAV